MTDQIDTIATALRSFRGNLQNEKALQGELFVLLKKLYMPQGVVQREYRLDDHNIVDFFIGGIAIEVKIKGGRVDIFKQCERYSTFHEVKTVVLLTNRSMGFPTELNGKPAYLFNLGLGWL